MRAARRRGRSLGLVGKTGVAILAGAPIAVSALESADRAFAVMRVYNTGLLSTAKYATYQFLNELSVGFGGGNLIPSVEMHRTDGTVVNVPVDARTPSGAWFKTSFVGGTLIAFDILVSWASRKLARVSSGVRFMGTKLTGGK